MDTPAPPRIAALAVQVIHTLEGHASDLSDCPPSKLRRCSAIGTTLDTARGRVLVGGEQRACARQSRQPNHQRIRFGWEPAFERGLDWEQWLGPTAAAPLDVSFLSSALGKLRE